MDAADRRQISTMLILLIGIDQLAKYFAIQFLTFQEPRVLFPGLALYLTHNTGISFSLLHNVKAHWLLIAVLCIICFLLALWCKTGRQRHLSHWGFVLILAGALGNLIDRVRYQYVIDYLYLYLPNAWSFAVFNLADIFITLGVVFIIIDEFYFTFKRRQKYIEQVHEDQAVKVVRTRSIAQQKQPVRTRTAPRPNPERDAKPQPQRKPPQS